MDKQLFIDDFDNLVHTLCTLTGIPALIAIDGRPCSGKTTLAGKLENAVDAQVIYIDQFFIPQKDWPEIPNLAFPSFICAIKSL